MSTKCSIKHRSPEEKHPYHFYEECFDGENVYLEIRKANFTASRNSITVAIPKEVWNEIVEVGKLNIIAKEEKLNAFDEALLLLEEGNSNGS